MEQRSLSLGASRRQTFDLPDAELALIDAFCDDADALFEELHGLEGWRQDSLHMFGRAVAIPRLHRWFADEGQSYTWSGITMRSERFPASLRSLQKRLRDETGVAFNTALANLYRDGDDSVSWHADDETELGPRPIIASLSLGATRKFRMRRKSDHAERFELPLHHGSMLIIGGAAQQEWEHCVPKTRRAVGARVNVTFRHMPT